MRPDDDFLPDSRIITIKTKYNILTFCCVSSPNSICEWIYKTLVLNLELLFSSLGRDFAHCRFYC